MTSDPQQARTTLQNTELSRDMSGVSEPFPATTMARFGRAPAVLCGRGMVDTLLFGGPNVTIGASLYRRLSNVLEELTPISGVMRFPNLM